MADVGVKKDNSVIIVFAINEAVGMFTAADKLTKFPLKHIKYPLLSRFTKGFEHDYKKEYYENKFSEYDSVTIRIVQLFKVDESSRHNRMADEAKSRRKYQNLINNTMAKLLTTSQSNPDVELFAFIEVKQGSENVEFETIWGEGTNAKLEETIAATLNSFFRTWDENWKWVVNGPSNDPAVKSMAEIKSKRKVKISIRYKDEKNLEDIMRRLSIMMFPDVRKEEIFFSQSDDYTQLSQ